MARKRFKKNNRKRNFLIQSFILLFLFIGIGYATLEASLLVEGSLTVKKNLPPTFPNLLKEETEKGTFARKSTSVIDDAYDSSLNTEPIYQWYSNVYANNSLMLNKVNVIFANHCWQMIRTTSSGGMKLLYNGEVVDGKCLSDRPNHPGYRLGSTRLSASTYFASDYEYDSDTSTFKLIGDDISLENWNSTNAPNLIGKYTCNGTSEESTCSTLYIIRNYAYNSTNNTNAVVYTIKDDNNYAGIGSFALNSVSSPLAVFSYMYNETYPSTDYFLEQNIHLDSRTTTYTFYPFSTQSISDYTTLWYADSLSFHDGYYELDNPYQVSSDVDYTTLYGKYFVKPVNGAYPSNISTVYYAVGGKFSTINLTNGKLLSDYEPVVLADSYVDNGDGTYTLQNTTNVSAIDWFANTYSDKYFCLNRLENPCTDIRFFHKTRTLGNKQFYTVNPTEYYYYGTGHNGLQLIDPVKIHNEDLLLNYLNYDSRRFFCLSHNSTCESNDDLVFANFSNLVNANYDESIYFKYLNNYSFGGSVTWDGEKYHLNNTIGIENYQNTTLTSSHHFICENYQTTCESVIYLYYQLGSNGQSGGTGHFEGITLRNGVSSASTIIYETLRHNVKDSTSKQLIELWYERNLLDYTPYLENVIFYNNKSLSTYGGFSNYSSSTDGIRFYPTFRHGGSVNSIVINNNLPDEYSYSVDNPLAPLKYSIGLPTKVDISFMPNTIKSPQYMLTADPWDYNNQPRIIVSKGSSDYAVNTDVATYIVRPVISLKSTVQYSSGDGSMENPYIAVTD